MKIKKWIGCILGLAGIVSVQSAEAQFKIVGYSAYYDNSAPSATQYSQVTHVVYAFLAPNSNGSLQTVPDLSRMQSIVSSGHTAGVKVMISCQTTAATWGALAINSGYVSTFVNNIVNFCNQYNLDGVDIDWEFPSPAPSTSATDYANLMSKLSTALHNDGKLLTAAVASWGSEASGVTSSVFSSVDWLNIMDYDNTDGSGMSTLASVTTAIQYWEGQGCPASKIVMGVPFYADPSEDNYSQLLSAGASANSDSYDLNGTEQGYNGIPTIEAKTLLCQQQGLGGMMIWTLGGDATGANSLLFFIYSASHPVALTSGSTYRLYNANSNLALDDTGGSTTNGTIMQQWTPSNSDVNQQWSINSWGNGYYGVKNMHSGLTLDDTGHSTTDGTFIQQWAQGNAQSNQEWAFIADPDGTFQIVNLYSMMDLQIANYGTQNGDQATQWTWGNNTSQEWWVFLNGVDQ